MNLDPIFRAVETHLRRLKIKSRWIKIPPVQEEILERFENKTGLTFSDKLKEFYLEYANGIFFRWEHKEDGGCFWFPNLGELRKTYRDWKEYYLWMDDYDFPYVDDPCLAKKTYEKMKNWIPFQSVGNGDFFCVDGTTEMNPVVYHQHNWMDGGSGFNGQRLGNDFEKSIAHWASVCFTDPMSLYWPAAFTKNGVSWTKKHFKEKYILPEKIC